MSKFWCKKNKIFGVKKNKICGVKKTINLVLKMVEKPG